MPTKSRLPRQRAMAALLALAFACAPPAHAQLPAMGDGGDMTVAAERKKFLRKLSTGTTELRFGN